MCDDVLAHALGRRGGQCHHGNVWQRRTQLRELAVFRAKIVPPLGNAVSLVDREARHVPVFKILVPALEHEPLGRGVEQLVLAPVQAAQACAGLTRVERGIQEGRRHAAGLELVDLILHEGDQG